MLSLAASSPTLGQDADKVRAKNEPTYLYQGADRERRILEGAKKEGTVVVYTTIGPNDFMPVKRAFEAKYGIKLVYWRAGSEKVIQRALTEARAQRYEVDVLETNATEMEILYREKLLAPFYSPAFKDIPPDAFPKHKYYVPDRFVFFVMAYNTNLVKSDEVPDSYEALLNPKWTGKLGIETSDADWFAAVVKNMGEEKGLAYFKKLSAMQPQLRVGHGLLAELVASGETPIALNTYNNFVESLKKRGAPIEWKALHPAIGRPAAIGLAKNAPHPYAALLFADFLLSKDGQQILEDRNRVPASVAIKSNLKPAQYQIIDSAAMLNESAKWEGLWRSIVLKGQVFTNTE